MAAYPSVLAKVVTEHWQHIVSGDYVTPGCPSRRLLSRILEACYLAASAPEEGRYPQFNVLVTEDGEGHSPTQGITFCPFAVRRKIDDHELRRLAPATDMKKSAIWVTYKGNVAQIAGLVDLGTSWYRARIGLSYSYRVPSNLIIQVDRPGRLKVFQGQFHVASLADGSLVVPRGIDLNLFLHEPANEALYAMGSEFTAPEVEHPRDYENFWFIALWNVFAAIANSVSLSAHGGMLIILPVGTEDVSSLVRIKYEVRSDVLRSAFIKFINARNKTADFWERAEADGEKLPPEAYEAELHLSAITDSLVEAIRFVVQLAGCDGGIVITSDLKLLGFGTEIKAEMDPNAAAAEVVSEPNRRYRGCDVEQFGMRHRAAIKLASRMPGTRVLAVSQDGPITAIWREGNNVLVKKGVSLANMNLPWS